MKRNAFAVVAVCAFILLFSGVLSAHHGTAAYDTSKMLTFKATVTDFRFINPHCQIYFDIKTDKGELEHWQGELTAPNKLARAGWSKHTLKAGDQITVSGYAPKGGGQSLWIQKLVGPDGKAMELHED